MQHAEAPARSSVKWLSIALASIAALAIAVPLLYRHFHKPAPQLHANDALILSSIQNATGETLFDATLSRAARVKLNESPYFNLVSDRALRAALEKAQRPASDQISADDARAVCSALNAKAIITGNVGTRSGNYIVTLIAAPCGAGRARSPSNNLLLLLATKFSQRSAPPQTAFERHWANRLTP